MKPYRRAFIIFSLCATLVLSAIAWLSFRILSIQANWETALRDAALEENARLALWRSEALFLPALALEESHLPNELDAAGRSTRRVFPIPPLFINRYFVVQSTNSPVVLNGNKMLASVSLNYNDLTTALPEPVQFESLSVTTGASSTSPKTINAPVVNDGNANNDAPLSDNWNGYLNNNAQQALVQDPQSQRIPQQVQTKRNIDEFQNRANINESSATNIITQRDVRQSVANAPAVQPSVPEKSKQTPTVETDAFIKIGALKPLIRNRRLFLARRIELNESHWVQACELDWFSIRSQLIADVRDILPQNDWVLDAPHSETNYGRQLSSLPVRLVTGQLPPPDITGWSALEKTLALAWLGVLIALVATGVLLRGLIALSERRAAFASAVTHELRTPLTTFRMYSEMLADGMVSETKRKAYLETLVSESNRLGHLVENVLSYARLERGAGRREHEVLPADSLYNRIAARLPEIANRAGMTLDIEPVAPDAAANVKADAGAVEQILFNLVDNACKYGRTADSNRIRVSSQRRDGRFLIIVSDAGPGVAPSDRARIFQPFLKSAKDAANSAPGVGLGLAISRRLARAMGGDLRLLDLSSAGSAVGASFVLELTLAPSQSHQQ